MDGRSKLIIFFNVAKSKPVYLLEGQKQYPMFSRSANIYMAFLEEQKALIFHSHHVPNFFFNFFLRLSTNGNLVCHRFS